jgi:NDP-sugar pyrophosphorylase family protein
MGTGGALREARPLLAEKFLVIYGDSYLPIDYWGVLQALEESTATGVVVVYDNRLGETMVNNNIVVGAGNRVTRYDKQASGDPGLTYVEAGVLAFRHSVLDLIPASGAASLENDVYPRLIANQQLIAYATRQRFFDIGTPERLKVIDDFFRCDGGGERQ